MKKTNEQQEHPVQEKDQKAFDDQRRQTMQEGDSAVNDDEEDDGTPILDEADLEENHISEDDAENIEWGPENSDKRAGNSQKQNITNTADTGSDNKGNDNDSRSGSNTMQPQQKPLK